MKREKVLSHLTRLEEELDSLLARLTAYSDEQLNNKPAPDQWSALQVLYHLKAAEQLSIQYVQKKLSFNPELKKAGLLSTLRKQIMVLTFNSPIKFKAPAPISGDALPEKSSLRELTSAWKEDRTRLRVYLESLPDPVFNAAIYRHPIGGRLSLNGMLSFFSSHFDRHKRQILRILEK